MKAFGVATAVSAALFCACTITVTPIKKQTPRPRIRPLPKSATIRNRNSNGTVSASWMLRYRELEHKFGEIDADRDITTDRGRFIISPEVKSHYEDMIHW